MKPLNERRSTGTVETVPLRTLYSKSENALTHGEAAAHAERLAGDVIGGRGSQKGHRRRHLGRLAHYIGQSCLPTGCAERLAGTSGQPRLQRRRPGDERPTQPADLRVTECDEARLTQALVRLISGQDMPDVMAATNPYLVTPFQ